MINDDVPSFLQGTQTGFKADPVPDSARPAPKKLILARPPAAQAVRPSDMKWRDPDWLLPRITPRAVQMEAMRRSIGGFALYDRLEDAQQGFERFRPIRSDTFTRGFNYYMQMRLGKTFAILNDFALARRDRNVRWLIVFVPNSLKEQWVEAVEVSGLDVPAFAFNSSTRSKVEGLIRSTPGGAVIAVNYEALVSDATAAMLSGLGPDVMYAYDESISLKNPQGVQSKRAWRLSQNTLRAVNASGKPVTQGPHDLYGQLRAAHQAKRWSASAFKTHFCNMGGFKNKVVIGPRNIAELQALLDPYSFVARMDDWIEDVQGADWVEPFRVDLTPEQKRLIKKMEDDFLVEIGERVVTADIVITRNLKKQQIRSGFIYDEDGNVHELVAPSHNPLLRQLRAALDMVEGKVIVVAVNRYTLDMLNEALADLNPAVIRGADWHKANGRDIEAEKRRYNLDPACRVLIGQEASLRYGHTLMGSPSDPSVAIAFFENSQSLNDRSQAEMRPQGAGQVAPVMVWDFFASELDKRCVVSLQRKEDMSAAVMGYAREQGILPYKESGDE